MKPVKDPSPKFLDRPKGLYNLIRKTHTAGSDNISLPAVWIY
jgi:hypothetical protein